MKTKVFFISAFLFALICGVVFSIGFFDNYYYPVKFKEEILESSNIFKMNPSFVASVINIESSFYEYAKSSKGAVGLMQLMPQTAIWINSKMGKYAFEKIDLYNPNVNIRLGTFYLKYLFDKFDDYKVVLCAYNAGEGVVLRWLSLEEYSANGKSLIKTPYKETNDFLQKFEVNFKKYQKKF